MIDVCTKKKARTPKTPQITLQKICWVRYPPITLKVLKFELAIKGKVIT
jgi:ribosomal protein S12